MVRYFEDFEPGVVFDCGAATISEAELIAFAEKFDPQPFHLDHAAADASPLGGLALSGWHTASVMMRRYFEAVLKDSASLGAPGLNALRWSAPARPDAPISVRLATHRKRESRSRPELGFVHLEAVAEQSGREICRFDFPAMIQRRGQENAEIRVADRTRPDAAELLEQAKPPHEINFVRAADVPLGTLYHLGDATFSADEIIAFASEFDPQRFHLSEEEGRASAFGGLAASGWHICAQWMRSLVTANAAAVEAAPTPELGAQIRAFSGPSPGFEDLKWRLPALTGDRFRFFTRFERLEEMPRRPEWALMIAENGAVNQFGALAFSFTSKVMVRKDATRA